MKQLRYIFFLLITGLSVSQAAAAEEEMYVIVFSDTAAYNDFVQAYEEQEIHNDSPNPFFRRLFKTDNTGKSKVVAAMLAFPITGITGIHRVYLGTKAYIPVVYMGTLGGCIGILPLVDFVVLLIDKDISPYENNGKVFMWLK